MASIPAVVRALEDTAEALLDAARNGDERPAETAGRLLSLALQYRSLPRSRRRVPDEAVPDDAPAEDAAEPEAVPPTTARWRTAADAAAAEIARRAAEDPASVVAEALQRARAL